MAKMVGLSRDIKIEWLNKVADLVVEGKNEEEIRNELNNYLSYEISSPTNIRKTREILMKIWVCPNDEIDEIRKEALEAYKIGEDSKTPIHWCMLLLSYPVFSDVCGLIGKLTKIQTNFTTFWLKEKLFEEWGERTTLLHSIDKILRTLKNLGVVESERPGTHTIKQISVCDNATINILVKTILALELKAYYEITELSSISQMFPFEYDVTPEWIYRAGVFELVNFGGKAVIAT